MGGEGRGWEPLFKKKSDFVWKTRTAFAREPFIVKPSAIISTVSQRKTKIREPRWKSSRDDVHCTRLRQWTPNFTAQTWYREHNKTRWCGWGRKDGRCSWAQWWNVLHLVFNNFAAKVIRVTRKWAQEQFRHRNNPVKAEKSCGFELWLRNTFCQDAPFRSTRCNRYEGLFEHLLTLLLSLFPNKYMVCKGSGCSIFQSFDLSRFQMIRLPLLEVCRPASVGQASNLLIATRVLSSCLCKLQNVSGGNAESWSREGSRGEEDWIQSGPR